MMESRKKNERDNKKELSYRSNMVGPFAQATQVSVTNTGSANEKNSNKRKKTYAEKIFRSFGKGTYPLIVDARYTGLK